MVKYQTILITVVVGLVALVSFLVYIGKAKISNLINIPTEINQKTAQAKPGEYPQRENMLMPIGFSNSSVIGAETTYTLSGSIYSINLAPGGIWKLIFREQGGNVYNSLPFFVTPQTSLSLATNSANLSTFDLKKDQLITIVYKYNNFTGTGELTAVKILTTPKLK